MSVDFIQRLSVSLTRTSLSIILTLGIVLCAVQVVFEYKKQQHNITEQVQELIKITQGSARRAIEKNDIEFAQEIVLGLSHYRFFHNIAIVNNQGQAIAIYDQALISSGTSWLTHMINSYSKDYEIALVNQSGIQQGVLILKSNNDKVLTPVYQQCLYIFIIGLIRNLLLGLILASLYHHMLSRPLTELAQSLFSFELEKNNQPRLAHIKHHEKNELGHIISSANRLIDTLETREHELEQSEKQLRIILNASPNLVFTLDQERRFSFLNTNTAVFYKNTVKELEGKKFFDIHSNIDKQKAKEILLHVEQAERQKNVPYNCEIATDDAEETYHVMHTAFIPYSISDKQYVLVSASDITAKVDAENRLERLAYFDTLTQLPNKIQIQQRLQKDLNKSKQNKTYGALLFIDIDDFKRINDTHGHSSGDALLLKLSNRMQTQIRKTETLARLGGDEFILSIPDVSINKKATQERVCSLAEKILKTIRQPVRLAEHELEVSASIGIALYPNEDYNLEKLLSAADTAMYQAKSQGRDRCVIFQPQMSVEASRLVTLESDIHKGIGENQFIFYLQPQLDSETRELVGAEALLRWDHPDKGQILPSEYINYLENSPMISKVGELMLHQVCSFIYSCRNRDLMTNDIRIAINISARELHQPNFIDMVSGCLAHYRLHGSCLEFEITEGAALMHLDRAIEVMHTLKELGISFALDDFGTGYSSLSYLKQLPVDTIKIDKSFIKDVTYDHQDAMLVASIIAIANTLKLQVVAEGVETEDQAAWLNFHGHVAFQGFLFDRPMPSQEFERQYLDENPTMALLAR